MQGTSANRRTNEKVMDGLLIYSALAGISAMFAYAFRNWGFRRRAFYRFIWLCAVCVFVRHQFFIWDLQIAFRDVGGPDAGFVAMGLGFLTLLSLPFTVAGFFLCFLWPKDGRLRSVSSLLTVLLTLGVWAGISWFWHRHGGPNLSYAGPFRALDQSEQPVAGARLNLEIFRRREDCLEIPEFIRVVDPRESTKSSLVLTSDISGFFDDKGLRAECVDVAELTHSNCIYHPPRPYDQLQPNRIFRLWRKGASERLVRLETRVGLPRPETNAVINLLTGQIVESASNGDLQVQVEFLHPDDPSRPVDRRVHLKGIHGVELAETSDPYPFAAVKSGYVPEYAYDVLPSTGSSPGGTWNWTKTFYVLAPSGPIRGAIRVEFDSGNMNFRITGFLNPNDSSNLEPDPDRFITDPEEVRRIDEARRVR